jgi:hypothetical protein
MDEGETNKQLHEENGQLKRENELLKAKILELEARLAKYENAHTPPSLRRGRNRKKNQMRTIRESPVKKLGIKAQRDLIPLQICRLKSQWIAARIAGPILALLSE